MSMRICRDGGGGGGGGGERFCQHWCQVSHGGENNPSANKRKSSTGGSVSGYKPPPANIPSNDAAPVSSASASTP